MTLWEVGRKLHRLGHLQWFENKIMTFWEVGRKLHGLGHHDYLRAFVLSYHPEPTQTV